MDEEIFRKIVDEASTRKELQCMLFILQNEPLLDKRLFDFIRYFKQTGTNATSIVVTNGTLLELDLVEKLAIAGLDRLVVSVNSTDEEVYKKISPGFDFKRLMRIINALSSNKRQNPQLILSFVRNRYNSSDFDSTLQYWRSKNIITRRSNINNRAGSLSGFDELKAPARIFRQRKKYPRKSFPKVCTHPFLGINFLFNGDALMCCSDWKRKIVLGNIRDNSILELFNGKILDDVRRNMIEGRYHEIESCRHCSLAGLSNKK